MALLIDSSIFIEAERRQLDLPAIVELAPSGEPLAVAAVTVSELLVGVRLALPAARQVEREAFVERITEEFPILSFDLDVARVYAEVWASLRLAGNVIPPHDLMIGATALTNGFDVLTHNVRDFSRIPGLRVREPGW